ncbi:MAG TPA: hypothetical protein VHA80_09075 [Solirubrobacterales bacterium]|nr:hypothetical protein [Solirubrobacterales bacterium]
MSKSYKEWTPPDLQPDAQDYSADPISAQVGDRETERVIADPEAGLKPPTVTRVSTRAPQPRPVEIERTPHDPNPPYVDRIEIRQHLEPRPESADRFSDDQLNREGAER